MQRKKQTFQPFNRHHVTSFNMSHLPFLSESLHFIYNTNTISPIPVSTHTGHQIITSSLFGQNIWFFLFKMNKSGLLESFPFSNIPKMILQTYNISSPLTDGCRKNDTMIVRQAWEDQIYLPWKTHREGFKRKSNNLDLPSWIKSPRTFPQRMELIEAEIHNTRTHH